MTPREKAISVLGQYFPMVSDVNMELINSIIDAAREGMVGEDRARGIALEVCCTHDNCPNAHGIARMVDEKRVKEIVMEADIATRKAFAKFVDQRLSAHRNEEHLPNGGLRRNAAPTENAPYDAMANAGKQREFAAQTFERIQAVDAAHENAKNSKQVFLSTEQAEAPWTPKVGEWVAIKFNNLITKVIYREGLRCDLEYSDGSKGTVGVDSVRPVVASDWIVEVEGFGKVEARYDKDGDIRLFYADTSWTFITDSDKEFARLVCAKFSVSIKPFEWKEGE